MNITELKECVGLSRVANQLGLSIRPHGRQKCPFCGSSTGFRIKDDSYYNCFACGVSGTIVDLPIHAGIAANAKESWGYLNQYFGNSEPTQRANSNYLDLVFNSYREAVDQQPAIDFLQSRGLDTALEKYLAYTGSDTRLLQKLGFKAEDLAKYGLIKDQRELMTDRVLFQIKDWNLRTQHLQGRSIDPNHDLRWLSTSIAHRSIDRHLFKTEKPDTDHLYICEGITDTLSLVHHQQPAVGTLGVSVHLAHHAETINKYQEVYFCLDNDRFAIGARYQHQYKSWRAILPALLELASLCSNSKFYCCSPPNQPGLKDINDWHQRTTDLPKAIQERKLPLPEFILRSFCHPQATDLQQAIFKYFYEMAPSYLDRLEEKINQWGSWRDYLYQVINH